VSVIRSDSSVFPIGVKFFFTEGVLKELDNKKYCRGFFFVRQPRNPNILCQAMVIG